MPKKTDPKVKERCVRQVLEHLAEYPSLTAAAEVAALAFVFYPAPHHLEPNSPVYLVPHATRDDCRFRNGVAGQCLVNQSRHQGGHVSSSYHPQRRPLELVRAAWGLWLFAAPRQALYQVGGRVDADRRSVVVTRVLGARQLAQAGISGLRPSPAGLAVGAWVDGVHALTAVALAVSDQKRVRTAGLDAGVAALWSVLGRRDITSFQTADAPNRGWQDAAAQAILPFLPGAPAAHPITQG